MQSFVYTAHPARVIFGQGSLARLPEEVTRLQKSSALILCTPFQTQDAARVEQLLGSKAAATFTQAAMHTPVEITDAAIAFAASKGVDSVISIGGGSTVGLGKAIAVQTGLPHICIPTTYAGSEMTPILGVTANGQKTTRSDPKILPGTVIYDPDLTLTLPVGLSATSGVNAIAHAVEGLYAANANPIISLLSLEGIRALASALPTIVASPTDIEARCSALYGSWLCGTVLGNAGMGLHHKLCHTLGGTYNLPHADLHTIILPHSLAYNAPAIPAIMAKLADVLPGSNGNAIDGINRLIEKLRAPRALKDFGFKEEQLDEAAELACTSAAYPNPVPLEQGMVRELLRRALVGESASIFV